MSKWLFTFFNLFFFLILNELLFKIEVIAMENINYLTSLLKETKFSPKSNFSLFQYTKKARKEKMKNWKIKYSHVFCKTLHWIFFIKFYKLQKWLKAANYIFFLSSYYFKFNSFITLSSEYIKFLIIYKYSDIPDINILWPQKVIPNINFL